MSVDPNVGSEQTYGYEFASVDTGNQDFETIATIVGSGVESEDLSKGLSSGKIKVGAGVETFKIEVDATTTAKKLKGDEKLKLTVGDTSTEPIVLKNAECGEGSIESIEGEGVCLEDNKTAQFVYTVSVDPNVGSEQTYGYEFASVDTGNQDFETIATIVGSGVESEDLSKGLSSGKIKVGAGVETFKIEVDATTTAKKLKGDEKLKLTVGDTSTEPIVLKNAECGEGSIESIEGEGVCLEDNKTAQFVYTVSVDPNVGSEQTYGYEFASVDTGNQDFETIATIVGSGVESEDLSKGLSSGKIKVGAGVETFKIEVDATTTAKKLREMRS